MALLLLLCGVFCLFVVMCRLLMLCLLGGMTFTTKHCCFSGGGDPVGGYCDVVDVVCAFFLKCFVCI